MGLIDFTLPIAETAEGFGIVLPAGGGATAATLRTVIALAARLSGDCPQMLVPGLLVRLAEAADTDPADGVAAAVAARTLSGYLVEHGIPLHALPETGLVLGDDGAHLRLAAINGAMAKLEELVADLEADAGLATTPPRADRPRWRTVGLAEARSRRGILTSARIRGRLHA